MKKSLLFLSLFAVFFSSFSQTLDVISDGAIISVYSDSVIIDGNFLHQNNDTIVNDGNVYLTGDWTNNNSASNVFTAGPDGWLHLSGSNQNIGGTTLTHFNNLELSGTGIKSLLNIDADIEDTLALTDREFSAGDNTVFVLNNATGSVTRTNTLTGGFVSSTNNGGLSRKTLSSSAYSFPVGSSAGTLRYRPVDLTPNSSSANTFKVRMANVNPNTDVGNLKDSTICDINSKFYHRIFQTSGSNPADVKIYFDTVLDGNFKTIAHWQNIPQWENTGGNLFNPGIQLSSLTKNSWTDFSTNPFALAILIPAQPTVTATGPVTFCEGDSVILDAGSGYASYLWSDGSTTQKITVKTTDSLTVVVSSGGTCTASSVNGIKVTVNPLPVPTITSSGSTTICLGDSVTLDATGAFAGYLWSTSQTSPSIVVNSTGNYSVTVTTSAGCSGSSAPVSVTVNNPPAPTITAIGNTVFCEGGDVVLDAGSGFSTYLWSNAATSQTITVDSTGTFSVTVTDASGCTGFTQSSTTTTVNPNPNVVASLDDTINIGVKDTLFVIGAVNYQWEPGSGSGNSFIVSPTEETTYIVTGTDANGCKDADTVKVFVDRECVYFLPNIFSPNDDLFNDELKVLGRGLDWIYLTIYDRWGTRVFENSDLNTPWDGKYNGAKLNTGVYVYILKGKCKASGEEFEKHGNVTLSR